MWASSKTRAIAIALPASEMPTKLSGEMSLTNGNSDCSAIDAASAVLPAPAGPSKRTERSEVRSEPLSWRMRPFALSSSCGNLPP